MFELLEHMRDAFELRVAAFVQEGLTLLSLELFRFAIETATPAFGVTTDHGGFDEQFLPTPRR